MNVTSDSSIQDAAKQHQKVRSHELLQEGVKKDLGNISSPRNAEETSGKRETNNAAALPEGKLSNSPSSIPSSSSSSLLFPFSKPESGKDKNDSDYDLSKMPWVILLLLLLPLRAHLPILVTRIIFITRLLPHDIIAHTMKIAHTMESGTIRAVRRLMTLIVRALHGGTTHATESMEVLVTLALRGGTSQTAEDIVTL